MLVALHDAGALLKRGGDMWGGRESGICSADASDDGADGEIWRGRFVR